MFSALLPQATMFLRIFFLLTETIPPDFLVKHSLYVFSWKTIAFVLLFFKHNENRSCLVA